MIGDGPRLDAARRELNLSIYELWLGYIAVGGRHDAFALRAYLDGATQRTDIDHDHIVHALNEAFFDLGRDHPLPYRRP